MRAAMAQKHEVATHTEHARKQEHHHYAKNDFTIVPIEEEAVQDAHHIDLSWRSWVD
jgi:hypothetical protein